MTELNGELQKKQEFILNSLPMMLMVGLVIGLIGSAGVGLSMTLLGR